MTFSPIFKENLKKPSKEKRFERNLTKVFFRYFFRIDRTKATVERARYNQEETALNQTEELYQKQKRTNAQLRQRQEDWKVTQMKRAHLSALKYCSLIKFIDLSSNLVFLQKSKRFFGTTSDRTTLGGRSSQEKSESGEKISTENFGKVNM